MLAAAVALLALVAAAVNGPAGADTTPIENTSDLPWTNPTHESNLEILLSQIATTIAKRDVKIQCEGDTDWRRLVTGLGGDPDAELGYVIVDYNRTSGEVRSVATEAELGGESVCKPLKAFAVAAVKPTKCVATRTVKTRIYVNARVQVKKTVVVDGKKQVKLVWKDTRIPAEGTKKVKDPPAPCFLGNERSLAQMSQAYWDAYVEYAQAILTVAHEAIHLSGMVGARTRSGRALGDPNAEAKAECFGMQKIAYVAEQLGALPADAQSIARFYWEIIYPEERLGPYPQYWSADCKPGGALDQRPAGKTAWP